MSDEATLRLVPAGQPPARPSLAEAEHWSDGLLDHPADHDHIVHFYQDEAFLYEAVAHFAGAGVAAGEPVLIVATEAHRAAFAQSLQRNGVAVDAAVAAGWLTMLDARETLMRFMVGDEPKWDRFQAALAPVLRQCRAGRPDARVRIFGEMVALLWE